MRGTEIVDREKGLERCSKSLKARVQGRQERDDVNGQFTLRRIPGAVSPSRGSDSISRQGAVENECYGGRGQAEGATPEPATP